MSKATGSTVVVLVGAGTEVATWPLTMTDRPTLAVVDELARLQLAARRVGCSIRLHDPDAQLAGLLDLLGLAGAVGLGETGGKAEGSEEASVQEVVVPDDPIA